MWRPWRFGGFGGDSCHDGRRRTGRGQYQPQEYREDRARAGPVGGGATEEGRAFAPPLILSDVSPACARSHRSPCLPMQTGRSHPSGRSHPRSLRTDDPHMYYEGRRGRQPTTFRDSAGFTNARLVGRFSTEVTRCPPRLASRRCCKLVEKGRLADRA